MPLWGSSFTPQPTNVDVLTCSASDCLAVNLTTTYALFIPGPPLDVERLRDSLERVVSEKFPRAGARLARRNGLLEFQIPKVFDEVNPPFVLTTVHNDGPYPKDSFNFPPTLPEGFGPHPGVLPPKSPAVHGLFRDSKVPRQLEDFLVPGTPSLHIHVVTYQDHTLIGLTCPHSLFDGEAAGILFRAWTAALNGQFDTISASPRDYSPLDTVQSTADEVQGQLPDGQWQGWHFLSIFGTVYWIVMFLLRLFREGKESDSWMFFPKQWLVKTKAECMAELHDRGSKEWVGTNDIVMAAYYKAMYAGRQDNTPVTLFTVVDLRRNLLEGLFSGTPYLNNAVSPCNLSQMPASQLGSQSILDTALSIRRSILAFRADADDTVRSQLALILRQYRGKAPPMIPGAPGTEYGLTTNWLTMKLGDLDFSGARPNGAADGPARPSFVFGRVPEGFKDPLRGTSSIACETEDGVWVAMTLGETVWQRVKSSGIFTFV